MKHDSERKRRLIDERGRLTLKIKNTFVRLENQKYALRALLQRIAAEEGKQ